MKNLKSFLAGNCVEIDDSSLETLAAHAPDLQELTLTECKK